MKSQAIAESTKDGSVVIHIPSVEAKPQTMYLFIGMTRVKVVVESEADAAVIYYAVKHNSFTGAVY